MENIFIPAYAATMNENEGANENIDPPVIPADWEDKPVAVYAKPDADGNIIAINSGVFLGGDPDGWVKIDEGSGDRYVHAQGNYFPDGILDPRGVYLYKCVDDAVYTKTPEEIDAEIAALPAQDSTSLLAGILEGYNE
jgi:hypothetical protein